MDVDQLREHLRSKRIWPFPGHGAFVPHSEMEDVLNLEMVQDWVITKWESLQQSETIRTDARDFYKIIAILICIDQLENLPAFVFAGVDDVSLPLESRCWKRIQETALSRGARGMKSHSWDAFEVAQWMFLSPVFDKLGESYPDEGPVHCIIPKLAVPPFTSYKPLPAWPSTSTVCSARIHRSHLPCFRPPGVSESARFGLQLTKPRTTNHFSLLRHALDPLIISSVRLRPCVGSRLLDLHTSFSL